MSIKNIDNNFIDADQAGHIPVQDQASGTGLDLLFDVNTFFSEYNRDGVPISSCYPILQKRMTASLKNISVSGTMMTTYAGTGNAVASRGYALIQVGKASSGIANALGGYGVAWKPLVGSSTDTTEYKVSNIKRVGVGEYNITLTNAYPEGGFVPTSGYMQIPYRSTSTMVFVSVQFLEYLSDGKTIRCLSGNAELIDSMTGYTNVSIYLVRPNVYIVDNTSSINDINLWDNMNDEFGFLSYLNCGIANIRPGIDYEFNMAITEDNGLEFTIDALSFSISSPARIPMYEFVAAEDTDSVALSVYGTEGAKWYYDNIQITSLDSQYPYLYCSFSTEGLRESIYIKTTARGYAGEGDTGMRMYACRANGSWELIGYNTDGTMEAISSDVIQRDDYVFRDRINIILIGMNTGGAEGNSVLEVDWVSLENSEAISTHLGGCIDAYIDAQCTEVDYTVALDPETGLAYLDNAELGIVQILKITMGTRELNQYMDYLLAIDEYSYTCRGSIAIKTPYLEGNIVVRALVCPGLVAIDKSIATGGLTPVGYDLLVKHRNVHYLDILGTQRATLLPHLTAFIETLPRIEGVQTLNYAQFTNYLQQKNILTTGSFVIVDKYTASGAISKSYLRNAGEAISVSKVSCFRVSSGQ